MGYVEYKGKKYKELDVEAQRVLYALGIYIYAYFPQDKVIMMADTACRHFGVKKFYDVTGKINDGPGIIYEGDAEKDNGLYERIMAGEEFVSDTLRARDGVGYYRISLTAAEKDETGTPTVIVGVLENYNKQIQQSAFMEMLADDYYSAFSVDFQKDEVAIIRITQVTNIDYRRAFASKPRYNAMTSAYINNEVIEEERAEMREVMSYENLVQQLKKKRVYMHDYRAQRANGDLAYVRFKAVNMSYGDELTNVVIGFSDVSKEHMEQWEHLAYYDQITGGFNYNYYSDQLTKACSTGYIVSMDVRDFKVINSVCGMQVGDSILRRISEIVDNAVGTKGFYGHVNADHFVFYLSVNDDKEVIKVIEQITEDFEVMVSENDIPKISPYFGVTIWEPGDRNAVMFSEANAAKHRIKPRKDINYGFYQESDNQAAIEIKAIEDAFDDAIAKEQFEVWYQPKYTPVTRELTGAEALVRWRLTDGTLVSPGKFIPVYEKNGMIRQLDEYVYNLVLKQQRKWLDKIGYTVPISINLSRASMYHDTLVEDYKRMADEANIDTKIVPMEITESATVDNLDIKDLAARLDEAGFPLHIDDFGAGYSSLSTLNLMRFDTLKLDKSLIDYIGEFGGDRLIKHTVALAKDLGLKVIAEGVENEDQIKFLDSVECDSIQGFFYSKPLPVEEFEEKLLNEKVNSHAKYIA